LIYYINTKNNYINKFKFKNPALLKITWLDDLLADQDGLFVDEEGHLDADLLELGCHETL